MFELNEISVDHEVEVVPAARVSPESQVWRLLAATVPSTDTRASGPIVRDLIVEACSGSNSRTIPVVAQYAVGLVGVPITLVTETQIAVEGEVRVLIDPGQASGRLAAWRDNHKDSDGKQSLVNIHLARVLEKCAFAAIILG